MSGSLIKFAGHLLYFPMKPETSQLYLFVKSLFEGQGEEPSHGAIIIEMIWNPRFLVFRLYEDKEKEKNTVGVEINEDTIIFRKYTGQGYQYEFEQRYRVGIRNVRTVGEQYMEDTCAFYKDIVHIQKAYHKY